MYDPQALLAPSALPLGDSGCAWGTCGSGGCSQEDGQPLAAGCVHTCKRPLPPRTTATQTSPLLVCLPSCSYAEALEENWGKPPGNLNSNGQELLIYGKQFGNVFIGVQPTFGCAGGGAGARAVGRAQGWLCACCWDQQGRAGRYQGRWPGAAKCQCACLCRRAAAAR